MGRGLLFAREPAGEEEFQALAVVLMQLVASRDGGGKTGDYKEEKAPAPRKRATASTHAAGRRERSAIAIFVTEVTAPLRAAA